MHRKSRLRRIRGALRHTVGALWLAFFALGAPAPAQQMQRGPTRSPHGSLQVACGSCHTDTSWRPLRNLPEFSHDRETRYALRGMHESVNCRLCHTNLVFSSVGTRCADCHADIHRRQFGARCEDCHTVKGWRPVLQNIKAHQNRFPLVGAHSAVNCESCHQGAAVAVFTGLSTQCISCHRKDYERPFSLDHRAAGLPTNCEMCHGIDAWRGAKFDHAKFAGVPLLGAHVKLDCAACHVGSRFKGTPAACMSCHAKDFVATKDPNHVAAGFPQNCSLCHGNGTWQGARFDHNAATRFALTGAHVQTNCASCHVAGRFAGTPTDCSGCHLKNFEATTNPNHVASRFGTNCAQCHATSAWRPASFDHGQTRFPLTGAHQPLECSRCHIGSQYSNTSTQCVSCHLNAFNSASNPNHKAAGFPQDCAVCHTTTQWQGAKFDHNSATKFPLTGAHTPVACSQCHANNRFAGTPTDCVGCHLSAFQKTSNPNHVAAGFPRNCALCHTTSQWQGASFDHSKARFTLTGAHVQTACAQCHVNNQFTDTPAQCAACHLTKFNSTSNPNHAAAGFPQDCSICHGTSQWQGAKFDHLQTKFPLTGAHTSSQCATCHVNGKFAGLGTACLTCHLNSYNSTSNPNHQTAGFPQQCEVCHSTAAWRPASFDHGRTTFPLTGGHVRVQCANCHIGGIYAGTPVECYACHKKQYDSVANPNHRAAGFPTNCSVCHTTTTWTGARFDHNKFPIYTGKHKPGVWTTCGECHTNASNYTVFTCTNCHTHSQTRMDDKHRGIRNYVFNSANCYACHPGGTE